MMISKKAFVSLSVMTVDNFLQLPSVRGKLILYKACNNDIYTCKTTVVRQNNKPFTNLLNKIRVGNIDDDVEKLLKTRFTHESGENYPSDEKNPLQMYAENEPAMKRN